MTRIINTRTPVTMLCIFFLIVFCLFPMAPSKNIDQFNYKDGKPDSIEYTLKMDKEGEVGTEASGYFKIPTNRGEITNASLKIKCGPDNYGNYLNNPRLDIGLDGDYEWEYNGKGYGEAGRQNVFSTGLTTHSVITAKRGSEYFDNMTYLLLPTTARIINNEDASMKIRGGSGPYQEDLVVSISSQGDIYYAKSNRDGTFGSVTVYKDVILPSNGRSYGIGLGDFDNDNDLDIVYGEYIQSQPVADFFIILNENQSPHPWGSSPNIFWIGSINTNTWSDYPSDFAVGDFDIDGNLDFITCLYRSRDLYLFRGDEDFNFQAPPVNLGVSYPGSNYCYGKDSADFDKDGDRDLVVSGYASGSVYYYENKGNGAFKSSNTVTSGTGNYQYSLITADFDNDYNPDILTKGTWGSTSNKMRLIRGKGDGTFYNPMDSNIALGSTWESPYSGDAFDFNYDGYQDVVLQRSGNLYYYKGMGNGNFETGINLGTSADCFSTAAPIEIPLGGCSDLTMNIGDPKGTTPVEISLPGSITTEKSIKFGESLNSIISSKPKNLEVVTDEYGNEMYKIPLRFESNSIGRVQLEELDIKYEYTATVNLIPPQRFNLTTDLNDLLPTDDNKEAVKNVYVGVSSTQPGHVTLSDLNIEFNGAPECLGIGVNDYQVIGYEDHDGIGLVKNTKEPTEDLVELNLTHYFTDDYDDPNNLTYGVYSNSDPEHITLSIIDDYLLQVNGSVIKDWFGTVQVQIWCSDTKGIDTLSNEFEISIEPVNDPPVAKNPIPNINLRENHTKAPIDLDDPEMEYFTDIDNEVLYYRAALVDPEQYGENLNVSVNPDTNLLQVNSISGYAQNIEVKVYCHDNSDILSLNSSELGRIEVYQILLVNITSFTDTFPPQWLPITLDPIPEDESRERILRITDYVFDPDDSINNLTFSIYSLSWSGYIDVMLDEDGYLSVYPKNDFDDTAKLTLLVTDDEHNYDLTTVPIPIISSNDLPIVDIVEPGNCSKLYGLVEVIGSAYDAENELEKVEICVGDDGVWEPVNGSTYWTYDLDVTSYLNNHKGASMLLVKARAEDTTGNRSVLDQAYYYFSHSMADNDGDDIPDYIDKFPNNPSEWEDSDNDGVGDNNDKFPKDVTQWNDTDGDGYGDNPFGNSPDLFLYDPTQWEDLDGDGHGDNPWGNVGDHYQNDPERWKGKDESEGETKRSWESDLYLLMGLGLIIAIILTVLALLKYLINLNRGKKTERTKQKTPEATLES